MGLLESLIKKGVEYALDKKESKLLYQATQEPFTYLRKDDQVKGTAVSLVLTSLPEEKGGTNYVPTLLFMGDVDEQHARQAEEEVLIGAKDDYRIRVGMDEEMWKKREKGRIEVIKQYRYPDKFTETMHLGWLYARAIIGSDHFKKEMSKSFSNVDYDGYHGYPVAKSKPRSEDDYFFAFKDKKGTYYVPVDGVARLWKQTAVLQDRELGKISFRYHWDRSLREEYKQETLGKLRKRATKLIGYETF